MSKRELGQLSGANDVDGPRSKRRRDAGAGGSSDVDALHSDPVGLESEDGGTGSGTSPEALREAGLKLWQTVRDAVNKDGRELALAFLKKPPKKIYPDYYQFIKQPIAFDDIKKSIETKKYSTLEEVKQDFELCFKNATTYNMPESDIYVDAEQLLKLVNKTYKKLAPSNEDAKSKTPSLNRLIKQRLQKLIEKTDDGGRVLSTEFMELPSKKEWPIYYKQIKKPQCLENISKKTKRKEYSTAGVFAADVELVFSNAMTFNQEHTLIWEDAKALRDAFRSLMSDMPAPFTVPEYTKPSLGKLKITMPARPAAPATKAAAPSAAPKSPTVPTVTIPPLKQPQSSPKLPPMLVSASKVPPAPVPTTSVEPTPSPAITAAIAPLANPAVQTQLQGHTPQYVAAPAPTTHYPNALYHQSTRQATRSPTVPAPASSTIQPQATDASKSGRQGHSATQSPAPTSSHPLKSVSLDILPRRRTLTLDHRDGVKSWALRLVPGETEIHVSQAVFRGGEEDESGAEDEEVEGAKEDEEDKMEVDGPTRNLRRKAKGRAKGRLKEAGTKARAKVPIEKKPRYKPGPIQVKFNSTVVAEESSEPGSWVVRPSVGTSILEIGESGGLLWKVYIQRVDLG